MKLSRRNVLGSPLAAAPLLHAQGGSKPNLVFLISDDHSYPDLGALGSPVQTPNLDRLVREGVVFDNCFVSSAQCSPNRSSILTGCSPHTTATSRLHTPMPEYEVTVIDHLRDAGYFTGAFRKVHQGAAFDKRWNYYAASPKTPFSEFFDKLPQGKPFYLHIGLTDPHRPYRRGSYPVKHDPAKVNVPKWLPDSPEIRQDIADYYDAISRMDADAGQVLALLKERNLLDNTLVIFTGDNGMPFPGAKGTCYEPGIHVPLVAWWPGKVKPGVRKELIAHVDLPSTWLEAAGIAPPAKMQGRSFLPLLTGAGAYTPREAAFSERNWHDNYDPIRSVRTSRYKLIFNAQPNLPYRPIADLRDSPTWASYLALARRASLSPEHMRLQQPVRPVVELYDLESDPHEFYNLANDPKHAGIQERLKKQLSDWMHDTSDYLPPCFPRRGEPAGRHWPMSL